MPSHQDPTGVYHHTFSASWLEQFAKCAEQARYRYFRLLPSGANEYTALGAAVHRGIETFLRPVDPDDRTAEAWDAAIAKLAAVESEEGYVNGGKWDHSQMVELLRQHLHTFKEEVYPGLEPVAVEQHFEREFYVDNFRTISLRGDIDYIDAQLGVVDWKTAGSPHKPWEKQKYAVQPTVYSWVAGTDSMRYVVFVHNKPPQTYIVTRTDEDVAWLRYVCLAAARHIEAHLPVWALNDSGWWCSRKWCPVYANNMCKGAFMKEEG